MVYSPAKPANSLEYSVVLPDFSQHKLELPLTGVSNAFEGGALPNEKDTDENSEDAFKKQEPALNVTLTDCALVAIPFGFIIFAVFILLLDGKAIEDNSFTKWKNATSIASPPQ